MVHSSLAFVVLVHCVVELELFSAVYLSLCPLFG